MAAGVLAAVPDATGYAGAAGGISISTSFRRYHDEPIEP